MDRRSLQKVVFALIECESDTITIREAQQKVVFAFSKSSKEPMVEQFFSFKVLDNDDDEVKVLGECCAS